MAIRWGQVSGRGREGVWGSFMTYSVGLPALSSIQQHPVVHAIVSLASSSESLGEQVTQKVVVWGFCETKFSDIVEINGEFLRVIFDKLGNRSCLLLLANLFVLLLVRCSLETLPGQSASQKVKEDVPQTLEVIPPRLLSTQMSVDTHVTGGTTETLPFPVRNVLLGFGVPVLLGHTEIDDVNHVFALGSRSSNQKVVRFDVSVNQVFLVDSLDPRDHLLCDHGTSLDRECPSTHVE